MQTEVETEEEVATEPGKRKTRRCELCGRLIKTRVCIACRADQALRRQKDS